MCSSTIDLTKALEIASFCLNYSAVLNESTAFWLKGYCQKILPAKYRERQKEYFSKKGMPLHVDVFLLKENGQLRKKVYFAAV